MIQCKCKCGKSFYTYASRLKMGKGNYCSAKCYMLFRVVSPRSIAHLIQFNKAKKRNASKYKKIYCDLCGKVFERLVWKINKYKGHYCTKKCQLISLKKNRTFPIGTTQDCYGYISIASPEHPFKDRKGKVKEHRLIMERKLGRLLLPTEIVHHKNGVKWDNRLKNLKLMTDSEHKTLHSKGRKKINNKWINK